MNNNGEGLGLGKITMFAIGATLASGVFSLSGDFAAGGAHTLAVLIGWGICGLGMLTLTLCFFRLSVVKPELTSGLYSYAKTGFGEYIGFNSAWGFWLSALLGNLSFITLFFASLGNFFPVFETGTNFISLVLGSLMVWAFGILVLRGVNEAIAINTIVVIAKVIPIFVMIIAIVFAGAFDWNIFTHNMAGNGSGISLMEQVRSTVYTTVWVFIGIEGAVVISGRAKSTAIAGKATVLAFISLFILYVVISILSMGVMTTEQLAALGNPPMAFVLESVVGLGKRSCKYRRNRICRWRSFHLYHTMRGQHLRACLATLFSKEFYKAKQKRRPCKRRLDNYSCNSVFLNRYLL